MNEAAGLHVAPSLAAVCARHHDVRIVAAAPTKRRVIRAFYRAVEAPSYAADNLDALADILGDLGWLPAGPVTLAWYVEADLAPGDRSRIEALVADVAEGSTDSEHPLTIYRIDGDG